MNRMSDIEAKPKQHQKRRDLIKIKSVHKK
jgi:hypothetical protein